MSHRRILVVEDEMTLAKENEHRLVTTLRSIGDGVITTDDKGRVTFMNPVAETLTGWKAADAKGKDSTTVFQITDEETREVVEHPVSKALRQGTVVDLASRTLLIAKDGEKTPLDGNAAPIKEDQDNITGVVLVFHGVTEHRRIEEALAEERNLLRTLIDNLPDYIYVKDTKSRFINGNLAVAHIMGAKTPDELIGKTDFDFYPPELAAQYYADEQAIIESGQPLINREESVIDQVTQKEGWLSTTKVPFRDGQGHIVGLVGMGRDITEHKRAQEAMEENIRQLKAAYEQTAIYAQELNEEVAERKRAEKSLAEERVLLAQRISERTAELSAANAELARAARLKDEFLASMSHELRTPLNAILGMSEILREQVYGPLNERQLNPLHRIEESGRHLLALINDILDLSKIEAGKLELQINSVSIESVCQASLELIAQTVHQKQLKVSFELDTTVATLQTDKRRLKQILVNLLSNAVKFTPEGGAVGLEVMDDAEHQTVHFTVWDTGIGIAKEDMKRLFKPFIQLDSSLARHYEGTGLGLVLVYRLAEMHGGSVAVESKVGQGSRFTISLPCRQAENSAQAVNEKERKGTSPLQLAPHASNATPDAPLVLLAEDNMILVETLVDYLQNKAYRVAVARNGAEAIEQARQERPAVILMDIQMPEMDGLEATRRLRADADLAQIPVIALTALAMPGDRERCLAAGANEYLSKPVGLKELIRMIEAQLEDSAQRNG